MKKKYVLLIGRETEKYTYFKDLLKEKNVSIFSKNDFFSNYLLNKFFKFTFSQKVNRKIKVFWKSMFFNSFIKRMNLSKDNQNILIFEQGWYDQKLSLWLKEKHPEIMTVLFFYDTIQLNLDNIPTFDPVRVKDEYDFILSYNRGDVNRYGYVQCNGYFSMFLPEELKIKEKSELVFIGKEKDRGNIINDIFDKCSKIVDCNFVVSHHIEGSEKRDGIHYIEKDINYMDYLSEEYASDCILEILKGDTESATFRCWEAVYYNKKLLTNWKGIEQFEYYNPKYMKYFERVEDIDEQFLQEKIDIDYGYKGENSPRYMLKLIDDLIQRRINNRS